MIAVGILLALWTLSGGMQTIIWALNIAYERDETPRESRLARIPEGLVRAGAAVRPSLEWSLPHALGGFAGTPAAVTT